MRKKAPPKIERQNEWFVASLKPAALSIFSDSFYPAPKRNGELRVFVSINQNVLENPSTTRVRVMNGFNSKTLRMLSKSVAGNCLDIKRRVNRTEFEQIKNAILGSVEDKKE